MTYKHKASYGSSPLCILYSKARDEYHELYHEPYHQLHYISITTSSTYIPPRRCVSYTSRHGMNITNSITNPTTNSIILVSRSLHIYTTLFMCIMHIKTRDESHEITNPTTNSIILVSRPLANTYHLVDVHPIYRKTCDEYHEP